MNRELLKAVADRLASNDCPQLPDGTFVGYDQTTYRRYFQKTGQIMACICGWAVVVSDPQFFANTEDPIFIYKKALALLDITENEEYLLASPIPFGETPPSTDDAARVIYRFL